MTERLQEGRVLPVNVLEARLSSARLTQRITQLEGREATLEVKDTGPGIAPEEQARIFDRFYRGDPARGRGGTGLGLALARSIVLVHSGRITVESVVGQGSCFRVVLPLVSPS